jgi:hypothetical protein
MAQAIGVPPSLIVPDETVQAQRQARAQQQQAMQAAQMAQMGASAAKDASAAKLGGDPSVLTNVLGGNHNQMPPLPPANGGSQ